MFARIYVPSRNATQSVAPSRETWVLEYEPEQPSEIEPLMGWTASGDMRAQISLRFASRDEAVAYAERHGIPYQVLGEAPKKRLHKKAYADNFRSGRKMGWTH